MNVIKPNVINSIAPSGEFVIEHWRDGKMISLYHITNGVTNEGKDWLLNANFDNGTQIAFWWMGCIDSASYTALDAADTYQNINQAGNGWVEFTSYTDTNNYNSATTRPQWINNDAAAQSIANTTKSLFNITINGTIKGVFLVGGPTSQTKSDNATGNVLWATALFVHGDMAVEATDQLRVTYTITI